MAVTVKIKSNLKRRSQVLTPFQKKLLNAPLVSEKQIKKIEQAGKLTGKWKV
jgi:hypothetical protein